MRSPIRHPWFRRIAFLAVVALLGLATAAIATTAVAENASPAAKKKPKGSLVRIRCANPAVVPTGKSRRIACRPTHGFHKSARGLRGKTGATGPPGPTHTFFFGRSFVPMTDTFVGDTGGNTATLASVAGINIVGLCRKSHADDDPGARDNSEEEAKVLIQSDTWATTFGSGQGWRKNVPKGAIEFIADTGDTPPGTHAVDNPQGEGEHQFLAASTNSNFQGSGNNHDEDRVTSTGWPAYRNATGFVSADFGEFKLDVAAGINVAGVGDRCGFAGIITTFPS